MGLTASPGFEADLGVVGGCADGDAVYADSIRLAGFGVNSCKR